MEPVPFLTEKSFSNASSKRGFTLIEMLVVIAIIVTITSIVLVSQNSFNKSLILTDTTYTVALSIREAQSLGLSSKKSIINNSVYQNAGYGIHFDSTKLSSYIQFIDIDSSQIGSTNAHQDGNWCSQGTTLNGVEMPDFKPGDCVYTSGLDGLIQKYTFSQGYTISNFCLYKNNLNIGCSTGQNGITSLDVVFQRPNTSTVITAKYVSGSYVPGDAACIQISSPDLSTNRYVKVTQLGGGEYRQFMSMRNFFKHSVRNGQQGFTLVEIMVSVSIFTIIMLAATAAYLNLIALDRQTRATNDIVDNLAFATDSMARAMRSGTSYDCVGSSDGNCTQGGNGGFSFHDANGNTVTYLLANGSVASCTAAPGNITACTASSAIPITDPRIKVDTLTFYVRGVGTADNIQPQVVFVIHGSIVTDATHANQTFSIQTTATERGIDL